MVECLHTENVKNIFTFDFFRMRSILLLLLLFLFGFFALFAYNISILNLAYVVYLFIFIFFTYYYCESWSVSLGRLLRYIRPSVSASEELILMLLLIILWQNTRFKWCKIRPQPNFKFIFVIFLNFFIIRVLLVLP